MCFASTLSPQDVGNYGAIREMASRPSREGRGLSNKTEGPRKGIVELLLELLQEGDLVHGGPVVHGHDHQADVRAVRPQLVLHLHIVTSHLLISVLCSIETLVWDTQT